MAAPLEDDDLTRVAMFLAQQRAEEQGRKVPASALTKDYRAATVRPAGTLRSALGLDPAYEIESVQVAPGMPREVSTTIQWDGKNQTPIQILTEGGTPIVSGPVFEGMKEQAAMLSSRGEAPPGKLPFISNAPTHETPAGYSSQLPTAPVEPGMTDAMAKAATAFRQRGAQPVPTAPSVKTARASGKRSREVSVSTTKERGPQPQLHEYQPLPRPENAEAMLSGLPEGAAKVMRERWGLKEAQADANRRSLAVEMASAANQIGSGLAGGRYDDALWDNQRAAARQPLADYQAASEEERRAQQDERAAKEAERAAQMEMEKFQYGKQRDKGQDQLARDRMAQEKALAEARLGSEAADRGLRRREMSAREAEAMALKVAMADEKEKERKRRESEKDLQRLGEQTSKAPFGEFQQALQDVDQLVPGLVYGQAPAQPPMGVGDRIARSLPGGIGNWAVSDEGQKYGQAIANLRDLVSRMRSGAVLNAGEEQHYLSLLGDEVFSDPRRAAAGINAVRQGLAQKLRNVQGAYEKKGTLDEYEATGATTYRAPVFSGTGRRVAVVDPNGRPATLDESELAAALKDGWRRR